jgi:hypothetical protein
MRLIAVLLFIATSLPNLSSEASAAPITVIDQQNLAPEMGSGGGVIFGQSFIPTLPRVDASKRLWVILAGGQPAGRFRSPAFARSMPPVPRGH